MSQPTVFIIDDDSSARQGITRLVRAAGMNVESFASARDFLTSGRHAESGCIVLDVKMPDMTGTEFQEELGKVEYHMPIIFMSAYGDVPTTARVMKKGAIDFLTKPVDRESLLTSINESLAQDADNRAIRAEAEVNRAKIDALTPREYETLTYVITGMMNKQIAHALKISEVTVKAHRGRVTQKLGVESVAELVRLCEKAGVAPADSNR